MTFQITSESDQNVQDVRVTGSIKNGMILFLLVVMMSQATSAIAAQNQVFYLHKWIFEDSTTILWMKVNLLSILTHRIGVPFILLENHFVTPDTTIETSTWTISLWLGYTVQSTGLAVSIGYVFEGTHTLWLKEHYWYQTIPEKICSWSHYEWISDTAGEHLHWSWCPSETRWFLHPTSYYTRFWYDAKPVSVEPATPIQNSWTGNLCSLGGC